MQIINRIKNFYQFKNSIKNVRDFDDERIVCEIRKIYNDSDQVFGRGEFYQSLPQLGIMGQRPSDYRIVEYGMPEVLKKNHNVLDIGCNVGFLDICVADMVNHITGIEYNRDLYYIALLSREYLNKTNKCDFVRCDFNEWIKKNSNKVFDVVFSFAVHYWLNVTPKSYSRMINNILLPGGYLFFESQNINTVDKNFDEYITEFLNMGFIIQKSGNIKDDGVIERKYLVFEKKKSD